MSKEKNKYTVSYVPEYKGGPPEEIEADSPLEAAHIFAVGNPKDLSVLVSSGFAKEWTYSIKDIAKQYPESLNYLLMNCPESMAEPDTKPDVVVNWTFAKPRIIIGGMIAVLLLAFVATVLLRLL